MPMPTRFTIPWSDVDPQLRHGGISDELAGKFVAPDLGDNWSTLNMDSLSIMDATNAVAASVSMHPDIDVEGYPTRHLIDEVLRGWNFIVEKIVDVTRSSANRTHRWCHAIPPSHYFALRPIRHPVRMMWGNEVLHYLLGTQVEIAELNRNGMHAGMDPQSADTLLSGLFEPKSKIMKLYFDLEVSGELSRAEVDELMKGKFRPGPHVSPPDQSAERPDAAAAAEALTGVDVIQWFPSQEDWIVFGRLRDNRYTAERIHQPEGSRPTTEDVAYEQRIGPDGQPLTLSTAGQP